MGDKICATEAQRRKSGTSTSWRMDETYIKVKGKWMYYYRPIDKFGKTLDFMLSEQRDEAAATAFFKRAIQNNGGSVANFFGAEYYSKGYHIDG